MINTCGCLSPKCIVCVCSGDVKLSDLKQKELAHKATNKSKIYEYSGYSPRQDVELFIGPDGEEYLEDLSEMGGYDSGDGF